MRRFENGILGLIPQEEWLNIGFEVSRPNDPIDGLFGDERTNNIIAYWQSIAAEYQIPVMAQFHGFDTEAQKTFRIPIDTHNIEKGLIKVKLNQSERVRELLNSGVREDELYRYVMDDGVRLADQVMTRSKVAKNELLATGKVTIQENNLDLTIDYGVPADQLSLELDLSDGADVPAQLEKIASDASAKGVTLNGMMASRGVFSKIRSHASVQKAINGVNGVGAMVRMDAVRDFISSEYGITQLATNDLSYGASSSIGTDGRPSVVSKRYYPKDKISFFSSNGNGKIGVGVWGDPPEVDLGAFAIVGQSTASPYVYVTQWMEKDPAVLWTKASALFIPVLYNPNSLWIATVKQTATEPDDTTGE